MKRVKILARKNLKMSSGKLTAQAVHAALALTSLEKLDPLQSVVVLEVTDRKFNEKINGEGKLAVVRDAGYTEVAPGTLTCLAFLEDDPRGAQTALATAL